MINLRTHSWRSRGEERVGSSWKRRGGGSGNSWEMVMGAGIPKLLASESPEPSNYSENAGHKMKKYYSSDIFSR